MVISLIHGDAMNLPFEDDEFDYVTIGFGLRNVPDYKHVLNELKRIVKPGGMVVCLETSQPTIQYSNNYIVYFKTSCHYSANYLQNLYKSTIGFKNQLKTSQVKRTCSNVCRCWLWKN